MAQSEQFVALWRKWLGPVGNWGATVPLSVAGLLLQFGFSSCGGLVCGFPLFAEAMPVWQLFNSAAATLSAGRTLLRINLDETAVCLYQGGGSFLHRRSNCAGPDPHVQKTDRWMGFKIRPLLSPTELQFSNDHRLVGFLPFEPTSTELDGTLDRKLKDPRKVHDLAGVHACTCIWPNCVLHVICRCPYSALTVPLQCPYSSPMGIPTVPLYFM